MARRKTSSGSPRGPGAASPLRSHHMAVCADTTCYTKGWHLHVVRSNGTAVAHPFRKPEHLIWLERVLRQSKVNPCHTERLFRQACGLMREHETSFLPEPPSLPRAVLIVEIRFVGPGGAKK